MVAAALNKEYHDGMNIRTKTAIKAQIKIAKHGRYKRRSIGPKTKVPE